MTATIHSDDMVLVASGIGPDVDGWLFAVEDWQTKSVTVEVLDHLNTSGIVVLDDCLYRLLSSPSSVQASGDFLVYDRTGVVAYRRVDRLADSHGLLWNGEHFVVPCSYTNEIFWLSRSGETAAIWRAPGEGDAWHVNGVHFRDGRAYATAFGTFSTHRGWGNSIGKTTGLIFDVATKAPIVTGLACPHDPMFIDGTWLVCDSYTFRVLAIDEAAGAIIRHAQLDGWTRGLTVLHDQIFAGVSGKRHGRNAEDRAHIAILDRATLELRSNIALPCEEILTVALVPRAFLTGLRAGFRTNDLRTSVQDRRDLFERVGNVAPMLVGTPMDPVERASDRRLSIDVRAPHAIGQATYFDAELKIKNHGTKTLFSGPPFPINVGIAFTSIMSHATEERRAALPEPLPPGATLHFRLPILSPAAAGKYRVKFTLLQEWVRWFDSDQEQNARTLQMTVTLSDAERVAGQTGRVQVQATLGRHAVTVFRRLLRIATLACARPRNSIREKLEAVGKRKSRGFRS